MLDVTKLDAAELIAAYEAGPAQLSETVSGMTHEQLVARPVAGKWSTLEVVCHLADCEQFFADRMKRTVAMNRPLLMAADIEYYSAACDYQQHELQEELQLLEVTRRQMARVLKLVSPEAWKRSAVHNEAGLITLRQLLEKAVSHFEHHRRFIIEKRSALPAG